MKMDVKPYIGKLGIHTLKGKLKKKKHQQDLKRADIFSLINPWVMDMMMGLILQYKFVILLQIKTKK